MIKSKKYIIIKDDSEIRIDRWLRRKFTNLPQSFIQKKLRKGIIRLNNNIVRANKVIEEDDIIEIKDFDIKIYPKKKYKKLDILSKEIITKFKKSIIFQNYNYAIINKWKGISTQGSGKNILSINSIIKNFSLKMNIVHRLDKDTTGLLIISKNYLTSRFFGKLFQNKGIKKSYLSICKGRPIKKEGVVRIKIIKEQKQRRNIMMNSKLGKETITNYKLLEYKNGFSTVIFIPITGKTHQIRLAAQNLNCSILGDIKYGKHIYTKKYNDIKNRLMLHSIGMSFYDNNIKKIFFADIPQEMIISLKKLGLRIPLKHEIKKYYL